MRFDAIGLLFCVSLLSGCFLDGAGQQRADGGDLDAGGCGRAETCNGADDDCDGTIDEDASMACSAAGTCTAGTRACVDGALVAECVPSGTAAPEACEGSVDEDCDGTVDEGCGCAAGETRACGEEEGACEPGTQVCTGSEAWGPCEGAIGPVAETCNGADDDCNGAVDDGLAPEPCGSDTGECTVGTRTCVGGALTDCSGVLARVEVCDVDMLDEDCDGESNEGCECTPGAVDACSSGACTGSRTCEASGTWGACDAAASGTETCNGEDDDCDGRIDEGGLGISPCVEAAGCVHGGIGGAAYLYCPTPLSWEAARARCMSFGYDLVVVETELENDRLLGAIGLGRLAPTDTPTEWWIGLRDTSAAERGYTWWNGAAITYPGWATDEPSHDNQCAMIDYDRRDEAGGGWDDKGCAGGKAFICEAPPPASPGSP